MIIKTLRHKYNSIGDLLFYMVNGMQDQKKDMAISHNLPSFDVAEMKKEFLLNDMYRQQTKATTRWYHEMLSFSPLSKEHLDTVKLQTITQEYIQKRNSNALCFAVAHTSEAHTHVHLCFSGSEYRSKKVLRMDDKTFKDLRIGMELFQEKNFPELKNSIVYLGKEKTKGRAKSRDKNVRKEKEHKAKTRIGKTATEKDQLKNSLKDAFNQSENTKQFYDAVRASEIVLYERSGRPVGVMGKRKYRFSTLCITKDMLLSLDKFAQRQQEMNRLTKIDRDEQELER